MSVINQMLKDLEKRTPEQGDVAAPVVMNNKASTLKIVLISLTVLISLNLLGIYIWNLQERVTSSELKIREQAQTPVAIINRDLPQKSVETMALNREVLDKKTVVQKTPKRQALIPETNSQAATKADSVVELSQQSIVKEKTNSPQPTRVKTVATKPIVKPKPTKAGQVSPKLVSTTIEKPVLISAVAESKMSVSRRQMTSEELVAQKLVKAEKSIKSNDIKKAEQLLEDVLIIEPYHKQARKKLAALWFGRKSFQQATNLLSQGISLDRGDAELRLLKARIHLKQGQYIAAYNTLKALPQHKQQEYQVMLANVSQQIEQYESAIQAYKVLIDMQAYSGRWHLGLAIVYDKNSQFSLAVTEYALALTKSDLTIASADFAQQRMQALGE